MKRATRHYRHRTNCGHMSWADTATTGGNVYCATCQKYVGVHIFGEPGPLPVSSGVNVPAPVNTRERHGAPVRAFPAARAFGAVGDHPERLTRRQVGVLALLDSGDYDTVEHERQSRLSRWQETRA